MTPTDKAAIEGLIELASKLEKQLDDGDGAYPDDYHEVCHKAFDALPALQRLLAGETREAEQGDPPEIPEVLAPVYKFLMERCHYWQPIIDDESLPPIGWKGVVEAETKRGHIEYRQAEYKAPLFGGPASWSAWTFREEGDWKPLRWLKKWDLKIGVYTGPFPHDDAGAVDYEDAAIDICHECGLDDNENTIRDIVRILRKHTSEDPHHG